MLFWAILIILTYTLNYYYKLLYPWLYPKLL
jgi:hypothetical protein